MNRYAMLLMAALVVSPSAWGAGEGSFTARGSTLPRWKDVSTGGRFTVAIAGDGTVWRWGNLLHGEGLEARLNRGPMPARVPGLTDITAVAAGASSALALRGDGTAWFWGDLRLEGGADGEHNMASVPEQVPGLANVVAIAAGNQHYLALLRDGSVWSWGNNENGQLGDGSLLSRTEPARIGWLKPAVLIAAGGEQSFAQLEDGSVRAWGRNTCGQLGVRSGGPENPYPIPAGALQGIEAISATTWHSMALATDGSVWFFGYELWDAPAYKGMGGPQPRRLPGIDDVVALATGRANVFVRADGSVWGWGANNRSELGVGDTRSYLAPVRIDPLSGIVSVSCGPAHCLALDERGILWGWGDNSSGQLGDGTYTDRRAPVRVGGDRIRHP